MNIADIFLILVTVFLCAISTVAIRYNEIKSEITVSTKIKKIKCGTVKGNVYILAMFVINIVIAIALLFMYKDNDLFFNMKRIALLSILWVAAYYDNKCCRIPNGIIILGLGYRAIILIAELLWSRTNLLQIIISEVIAAAALVILSLLCILIIKNSLGMGDIKLFIVMGLLQGVIGVSSSVFASLLVSFFVSVYLLLSRKKTRKDAIPFAPCILIGTMLSVFLTGA